MLWNPNPLLTKLQTGFAGITALRTLPRAQFSTLQQRIFPLYFTLQSTLPVLVALTYPSPSPLTPSSIRGVLDPANRWTVLYPLATVLVSSLLNRFVLGPQTAKVRGLRQAQEVRDGKASYDPPPHSKEMIALTKRFGRVHIVSALLNATSFVATMWYGVILSARL